MTKPLSQTITPVENTVITPSNESLLRKIFYGSLLLMLGILFISGYDSGFNSDEMDMNIYGKANIAYYTSGGKDTTFLHPSHNDGVNLPLTLPYYGSGFEYFATGITSLIGDHYEYNTRHILNQIVAILGLLFSGLIAKKIKDYKAALITIWLLYLTPILYGLAIFNTKDIPFMSAYVASIYFAILFFERLPKPDWKTLFGLFFSLWFLLSIRIGGILMIGFIGIYAILEFYRDKSILQSAKQWLPRLAGVIVAAFIFMILLWPFVLQNPAENIIKTINVVKEFPQKISFCYDGEYVNSLELPKGYLLRMMSITIPVATQVLLLAGFIILIANWKKTGHKNAILLLIISGIFPVIFSIYSKMPLYNSWRHLLFIYPSIVIACSVGIAMIFDYFSKPLYQYIALGLMLTGFIGPVKWCMENNPYQYAYYNEIVGGYDKAYGDYDADYWQISVKEAIDWVIENEPVSQAKDSIIIATNAYTFSNSYVKRKYPGLKLGFEMLGEKSGFGAKGTYTIYSNIFLEPQYVENCFPNPLTYHTINIGNRVAAYITKDTLKYLFKGYTAFQTSNYALADSFFDKYINQIKVDLNHPMNVPPFFAMIAFAKLAMNKKETSYKIIEQCLKAYPNDYITNLTAGILFFDIKNYKLAKQYLMIARDAKPAETAAQTYLDMIP